jgi:peptide/nickel transport system substrate-binding protein
MRHSRGLLGAFLALLLVGYTVSPAIAADGQMTWGVHNTYGTYPDIEGLIQEQASGVGPKREAVLQKIQQLMHEKTMYAPIWELGFLNGVGPRVAESGLGLIPGHAYSAPYEDLRLAPK